MMLKSQASVHPPGNAPDEYDDEILIKNLVSHHSRYD